MHYIAYFFAGALLANAIPHLVHGISGKPFQTPFASPPGKGLSSSIVNVLWAAFNLAAGYFIMVYTGFDPHDGMDVAVAALGALAIALMMAYHFGKLHGGNR